MNRLLAPAPTAGLALIRAPLAVAAVLLGIAMLFGPTVGDLLAPEEASERPLALFAFLAMLWLRRVPLSALPVRPCWPALPALATMGALWLVGQLSFTRILVDGAVIGMLPLALWVLFGRRWLRQIALPLVFLLFALPLAEPLTPLLVKCTTVITVATLALAGIPVFRDGAYLATPSGQWLVADACAGTQYLLTCLLLGLFYASLLYRSPGKRLAFVAGAIFLGIVGNGLRAGLTIAIAHFSHNAWLREDHSTFGWLWFAALMLAYGGLGWRWRDEAQLNRVFQPPLPAPAPPWPMRPLLGAGLATLFTLAIWPLGELGLAQPAGPQAVEIADIVPQHGWSATDRRAVAWQPAIANPSRQRVQSFSKGGERVDVFIGLFQHQSPASKLVSVHNRLVAPDQRQWAQSEYGTARTRFNEQALVVDSGRIVGAAHGATVWRWYWLDRWVTASSWQAKLRQIAMRLRGQDDSAAWVAISTPDEADPALASQVLQGFMHDMGAALAQALATSTGTTDPAF